MRNGSKKFVFNFFLSVFWVGNLKGMRNLPN